MAGGIYPFLWQAVDPLWVLSHVLLLLQGSLPVRHQNVRGPQDAAFQGDQRQGGAGQAVEEDQCCECLSWAGAAEPEAASLAQDSSHPALPLLSEPWPVCV